MTVFKLPFLPFLLIWVIRPETPPFTPPSHQHPLSQVRGGNSHHSRVPCSLHPIIIIKTLSLHIFLFLLLSRHNLSLPPWGNLLPVYYESNTIHVTFRGTCVSLDSKFINHGWGRCCVSVSTGDSRCPH